MVHSIVLKFEKIWLSGTLIIIRKPKVWRTDGRTNGHDDPYIHPTLVERGYKKGIKKNIWNEHIILIIEQNRTEFLLVWNPYTKDCYKNNTLIYNTCAGTYKVRNEIETKWNETKRNEINKNETKRNEINEMKTKPTKAKRNQRKQNEIRC